MPTFSRLHLSTPRIALGLPVAASQMGWVCTPTPDHCYVQVARFERHLPGLGETVAYVTEVDAAGRRGPRQLAVRGSGLRQSIERVGELEEQARVRRWGAMTPELVAAVDRLRPGEELEVAFLAVSDLDWSRASPNLLSGDVEVRTAAYRDSRLRVGAEARRLADRISVRGLRHVRPLLAMPMATAIVSDPRALVRLARDPSVAAVFLTPRATQVLSAPLGTYPEAGRFPKGHTDVGSHCLNDAGYLGAEQRIGIIEGRGTGFYLRHDAFAATQPSRIHYQHEPYTCSPDAFNPAGVGASSRWFKSTHCQEAGSAGLWDPKAPGAFGSPTIAQVCIADGVLHNTPICVLSHNESVLSSMITSGRDAYPDGQAVRLHGPVRASVFYANQGDVWETGAGESVPPNPDGSPGSVGEDWRNVRSVGCDLKSVDAAVDWLATNGVRILSESYFCDGAGQEIDGMVQDQFARQNAILTFRAAGNTGKKVVCPSRNGVCVGSHKMGASELAFDSSWQNLDGSDREKPDVTAMGTLVDAIELAGTFRPGYRALDTPFSYRPRTCVEVHGQKGACDGDNLLLCLPGDDVPRQVVCDTGICGWDATAVAGTGANRCAAGGAFMDPTRAVPRFAVPDDEHAFGYFRQVSGTSFATPLLAGAAALVSEYCGELSPLELRAILRASGYARNPEGSTHSGKILTSEGMQTEDGRDGAGAPSTVAAAAFCGDEPIPGNFPPMSTYGSVELDPSVAPSLPAALADGVGALLWQGRLRENDRVRAELVWHACPASAQGESAKATNFNLALCKGSTCVAHSLSIDDNNEGFDAGIEQAGDYQLYWWSPAGTKPCFGKPEPAAWALAHGPRAQFAFGGGVSVTRPVILAALLWFVACGGETTGGVSSLAPGGGGGGQSTSIGPAGGQGGATGLAGKAGHAAEGSAAQYPVGAHGQPILPDAERPCSACIRDFHANGPHTKECEEGLALCKNVLPSCGPYLACSDTTACNDALSWDRIECVPQYCPQPTDVASYPKGCNDCDACADACPHLCNEVSGSPSLTPKSIYRETTAECKKCVGELGVGEFASKSCAGSPAAAECLKDPLCGGMVKCMAESGCVMAHDEPYDGLSRCLVRHCPQLAAPSLEVNIFESCLLGGCEKVCGL